MLDNALNILVNFSFNSRKIAWMRKILLIILAVWLQCSYASFFGLFGGGSSHHRSKPKVSQAVPAPADNSSQYYQQWCSLAPTNFGFQISCVQPPVVTSFKSDASASVKCKQLYNGVSKQFPQQVSLSTTFINSLNLCSGSVHGPFQVSMVNVTEQESGQLIQANSLTTFYSIDCVGKVPYESTFYLSQQESINRFASQNLQQCLDRIPTRQVHNFLFLFYICIGLALISLGIISYKYYKNRQ